MAAKKLAFDDEARRALEVGVDKVAHVATATDDAAQDIWHIKSVVFFNKLFIFFFKAIAVEPAWLTDQDHRSPSGLDVFNDSSKVCEGGLDREFLEGIITPEHQNDYFRIGVYHFIDTSQAVSARVTSDTEIDDFFTKGNA